MLIAIVIDVHCFTGKTMANRGESDKLAPVGDPDGPYCQQCDSSEAAEAYCIVCRKFQCSMCFNAHRRSSDTRHHQVLHNKPMLTVIPGKDYEQSQAHLSEYCEEHPHELIKYFCPQHQSLHCGDCVVLSQHKCKMEVISKASVGFKDSSVYKDVKLNISQLADDACEQTIELEKLTKVLDVKEQNDKTQVLDFQSKVIARLNEKFQNLTAQITQSSQESKVTLSILQEKSKENKVEATGLKSELVSNESNDVLLFISTYKSQKKARAISNKLRQLVKERGKIQGYVFVPNHDLEAAIERPNSVGIYRNTLDVHELSSDEVRLDGEVGK